MDIDEVGEVIFNNLNDDKDNQSNSSENDFSLMQRLIDAYDYQLLTYQAFGQLASVAGYLYWYVSTIYGMQVINNKYSANREELVDPDPDIPALAGAEILLIAQSVLLQVSRSQYFNFYLNYNRNNLNTAKSATYEIYLGDFIELIAYTLSYLGTKQIYEINHSNDNPFVE
ncbi:MAG: hypothetical protein SPJ62_02075 [Inconstantimicrobium porci]|uniref:hypothetical protein n=1 Tax=Inconstantimicrobium porci TaxID=2652291 RepID=UPI002409260D|nr:hypothetical protein [Inconstantimicrobium porci]MDD6769729.1 hypothetical protein [Inconstantimicrobium porci]MDY5910804.1 hypothetical protein [Inconstantimicrobium porci]